MPKLVLIEWLDSVQPSQAWQFLEDFEPGDVVRCSTAGWLISEDDGVTSIAGNIGQTGVGENMQACGIMQIPSRSIVRIEELQTLRPGPKTQKELELTIRCGENDPILAAIDEARRGNK